MSVSTMTMSDGGYSVAMLWVFVLMAVIPITAVVSKKNEQLRQRIGAEIEAIKTSYFSNADGHSLASWLTHAGVETTFEGYSHTTMARTKIVTDASLPSGGFEVVSQPLFDGEHKSWFVKVGEALRGVMSGDHRACGFHVHIGLRDPNRETTRDMQIIAGRCVIAYSWFMEGFRSLVSPSRQRSEYASQYSIQPDDYRQFEDDDSLQEFLNWNFRHYERASYDRYFACNVTVLNSRGTVEYRLHQGTANPSKMAAWADLHYLFTCRAAVPQAVNEIQDYGRGFTGLMNWLGLATDDPLRMYYSRRMRSIRGLLDNGEECSECGSKSCDHDSWCESFEPTEAKEFIGGLGRLRGAANSQCNGCGGHAVDVGSPNHDMMPDSDNEYHMWCNECGDDMYFSAIQSHHLSTLGLGVISTLMAFGPWLAGAVLIVGCGIGAIHRRLPTNSFNMKGGFRRLWVGLGARGRQASGLAFQRDSDHAVWYIKSPHSPEAMSHHVGRLLTKDTAWTMCHTRFATHGVNDELNAHPHFSPKNKNITLVHNGVVGTHERYRRDNPDIEFKTECDSETVAQILEDGGIQGIIDSGVTGSMSLIWSDAREPKGTLHCWTNGGNPLSMARLDDKDTGPTVIASEKSYITKAFGARVTGIWDAIVGREYIMHPDGTGSKVDHAKSEDTDTQWTRHWSTYTTGVSYPASTKLSKGSATLDVIEAAAEATESMDDLGSYPPQGKWHGYDANNHQGLRPNGTAYYLDQYVDPVDNYEDMKALLWGDLDVSSNFTAMTDEEWTEYNARYDTA